MISIIRKESGKVLRFAMVGLIATTTHIITILLLVEWSNWGPLWANLFAFALALLVSFGGHYHWTFKASTPYTTAFPKFISIALLGLGINQAIMFSMVSLLALDYRLGLTTVVLLVPAITFLANRLWTFQPVHF